LQHYLGHTNIRGKHRACRFAQASQQLAAPWPQSTGGLKVIRHG
jgi:hypothetical protein